MNGTNKPLSPAWCASVDAELDETAAADAVAQGFEAWWQTHGQMPVDGGEDYEKTFAFRAWEAAAALSHPKSTAADPDVMKPAAAAVPAPGAPMEPDNTEVICPHCAHQFRAIPTQVQQLLLAAGLEPPFLGSAAPVAQLSEPPEGWKLAPIAPTMEMVRAGGKAAREYYEQTGGNSPSVIYRAMLAAATTPKD